MAQTRLTPRYYQQFQCIGDRCENNCCQGWSISIDKASYQHYLKHPQLKILAREQIELTRTSKAHWGTIKLTEQGTCPFLDGCGLCSIHKLAGPELLSDTCRNYPRIHERFGEQHQRSLNLSCPEACRQILLSPEAMQFSAEPWQGKGAAQPLPRWSDQLHLYCMQILLWEQLSVEERLFMCGMLIQQAQQALDQQQDATLEIRLEHYVQTLNQLVESGQWQGLFAQVPLLDVVQWNVLRQLSHLVWQASQKTSGRSNAGLQTLHRQLAELLAGDYHSEQMSQLHTAWCERVQPWLAAQQPQLLSNYLCYYVFHHHFPCGELRQPLRQFRMLLADYFLLRSYLSLLALTEGELTTEAVINLFHHYHTRRQHNHLFREALHESLLASDMDQDLALYALLKLKPA